ncbi:hypothetical protein HanRHA438_Chr15g0734871 [Helianthus annuus]|nr:hypothetical protein HanPSC8_Chr15g0692881 [Helianthus annuus]KAJ0847323.1 hypothetical protein HanRHA438_Chr15g0734871 [Helianthus annuus]
MSNHTNKLSRYLKMDDLFMNPFCDVFAYTSGSGDGTTNNTNETTPTPNTKKIMSDAMCVESAYGTYNKPPKLMAIEDYNRWATRFEEWLKAFAFPSWKSLKNGC